MFLSPTAKPTPRLTPSPRVVFPAPPGRRIGSRGSSSAGGTGSSAQRRITSATGSVPVISWPVGSRSPGPSALRSRSSTGSMPSAAASLSICASCAKQLCTAPKPRLAPAEGAAHAGQVDPHLLGREAEAGRDLVAVDVQPLRRDVDVDATLAVGHGEPGFRPEEGLVLDPEFVHARDGHVTLSVGVAM